VPPHHFESEVESFLEGSHGDRTHIKRANHHTVTPLCGTLLIHLLSYWGVAILAEEDATLPPTPSLIRRSRHSDIGP